MGIISVIYDAVAMVNFIVEIPLPNVFLLDFLSKRKTFGSGISTIKLTMATASYITDMMPMLLGYRTQNVSMLLKVLIGVI